MLFFFIHHLFWPPLQSSSPDIITWSHCVTHFGADWETVTGTEWVISRPPCQVASALVVTDSLGGELSWEMLAIRSVLGKLSQLFHYQPPKLLCGCWITDWFNITLKKGWNWPKRDWDGVYNSSQPWNGLFTSQFLSSCYQFYHPRANNNLKTFGFPCSQ